MATDTTLESALSLYMRHNVLFKKRDILKLACVFFSSKFNVLYSSSLVDYINEHASVRKCAALPALEQTWKCRLKNKETLFCRFLITSLYLYEM
jgi:hypothetical protein